MTLAEILASVTDADVLSAMRDAYPEEPEGNMDAYAEKVLPSLRQLTPTPRVDTMKVVLGLVTPDQYDLTDRPYVDVSGSDGETKWAIEFTHWAEWLGMEVMVLNADMTPAQIVAHCIWEMTWAGFDPSEVAERKAEIDDAASDLEDKLDSLGPNPTQEDLASIGLTTINPKDFE